MASSSACALTILAPRARVGQRRPPLGSRRHHPKGETGRMYRWSDEHVMVRDAIRQFVEKEIKPNLDELEHGDTPPYDVLRKPRP